MNERQKICCIPRRSIHRGFFVAALLAATATLCSMGEGQAVATGAADLPAIVIGVSNVQSGPSAALGKSLLAGSQAYFDKVNQQGGVLGRRITLLVKDDGYEPGPAVENTDELIRRDKVFFLFDYVGTPTLTRVLPLLQYYASEHIVNVAPFTGADPQRQPPYDNYVFNIRASYRDETRALVRHLWALGYRRIGYFGQADAYGMNGRIGVSAALEELGLQIAAIAAYRRNTPFGTDMTAQVKILRDAGADAVILFGVYGPCAAFIRDARAAGWNVPVATVSFVGPELLLAQLEIASRAAHRNLSGGLMTSLVVPPLQNSELPLVKEYLANFPEESRGFISLEGWLNAAVVTEALRRAGNRASREDFIHALESLHGWDPGWREPLNFSPTSHQATHKVWLARAEAGRWTAEEMAGRAP